MNCFRVCKFYARGICLKGDQCDFSHQRKDTHQRKDNPVDVNFNSDFFSSLLLTIVFCIYSFLTSFIYLFIYLYRNRFAPIIRKGLVLMVVGADISMSKLLKHHLRRL